MFLFQVMKRFSMVLVNYNNSSITHCFCTATIIGSEASHIKAKIDKLKVQNKVDKVQFSKQLLF